MSFDLRCAYCGANRGGHVHSCVTDLAISGILLWPGDDQFSASASRWKQRSGAAIVHCWTTVMTTCIVKIYVE